MAYKGIDFVILWVDGSDPSWQASKANYAGEDHAHDSGPQCYRDWGLLKYWFRAVEANAPWVRTVHLVTCGQVPAWLDTSNPRLNLVFHDAFMPEHYLPTFSANPIELNLHRIEGLAEQFVYFNDDMFVGAPASPEDFFRGGLPVDLAALNAFGYTYADPAQLCVVRDTGVINKHFNLRGSLQAGRGKWTSAKAGRYLLRTLALKRSPRFPGFVIHHCALPLLKGTFEEVWEAEPALLEATSMHRFRDELDVNIWLVKEWQLASGRFEQAKAGRYRFVAVDSLAAARDAAEAIRSRKFTDICVNDSPNLPDADFEEAAALVRAAFEAAYPNPSSFEK